MKKSRLRVLAVSELMLVLSSMVFYDTAVGDLRDNQPLDQLFLLRGIPLRYFDSAYVIFLLLLFLSLEMI